MNPFIKFTALALSAASVQAAQISGKVFYDGEPVPNTEIRLWRLYENSDFSWFAIDSFFEVFTDTDGSYLLEVEADAVYVVEAVPPDSTDLLQVHYSDAHDIWDANRLTATDETPLTNINIHLSMGAFVSGIVTGDNQPISDAYISMARDGISYSCYSDETGAFQLLVKPGTNYTVSVYPPDDSGFQDETYSNSISAFVESPVTNIYFDLAHAARISGTVRSGTNRIANASVEIYQTTAAAYMSRVTSARTDTNGIYDAWVAPGSNYIAQVFPPADSGLLEAYYDHANNMEDAVLLSVTRDSPLTGIDFDLDKAARISGTVSNGTAAVSNAFVRLEKLTYDDEGILSGYETVVSTFTDEAGFYSFVVAEGTNYIVSASLSGSYFPALLLGAYQPFLYYQEACLQENATLISTSGESPAEHINIDLSHLPEISGTVSADGVPVAEAKVTVYKRNLISTPFPEGAFAYAIYPFDSEETDTNGAYSVRLPPGSNYYLRAEAPEGSSLVSEYYDDVFSSGRATLFSLELDQTVSGIDFDLSPGVRVQGSVSLQNGQAVQIPYIYIQDIHGNALNHATGTDDGTYAIYAPTGMSITVRASGPDCQSEYYCDTFNPAQAQTFSGTADDLFTANFVLFSTTSDQDGDGLMDYMEDSVPDGIFTPGVDYSNYLDADTDHDGQNDNTEKICRTDPYNPWDYLHIRGFKGEPNAVQFSWLAESGVQYQVERCSDLSTGQWIPVSEQLSGQGLLKNFTESATSEPAYYRVRVITP